MGKAFLLASLHSECFNSHIFKFYIDKALDILFSFSLLLPFLHPLFYPFFF